MGSRRYTRQTWVWVYIDYVGYLSIILFRIYCAGPPLNLIRIFRIIALWLARRRRLFLDDNNTIWIVAFVSSSRRSPKKKKEKTRLPPAYVLLIFRIKNYIGTVYRRCIYGGRFRIRSTQLNFADKIGLLLNPRGIRMYFIVCMLFFVNYR